MAISRLLIFLAASVAASVASPLLANDAPTVLVTGANRGLGFVWAGKYAARGWNVIATARRPENATDLQSLAEATGQIRIEKLDVTVPASIDALAARLQGTPIDILINNVGMIGNEHGQQLGSLDPSQFDRFMRVNALGALLVTERLLPNIRASEQKKVAGISAVVASFDVYPRIHPGLYYYKASKAALNMILRNIAMDTRDDGIAVAVLSPGVVNTYGVEMSPDMPGLVDIDTSVDGMMRVMDDLTVAGSGKWYRYSGEIIPW